jgi:transcription elongation factor S-II
MEYRKEIIKELDKIINNEKIIIKIEQSIYNFTNEYIEINNIPIFLFEEIYENKSKDIIKILNINDNIIKLIIDNKILPEKLAYMKDEELIPEKYEDIIKKKELNKIISQKKGTTAFECKKCHARNAEIIQKQTRAADEPPTTFITCLNCGNKSRI